MSKFLKWATNPNEALNEFLDIPCHSRKTFFSQINQIAYQFSIRYGAGFFDNSEKQINSRCQIFLRDKNFSNYYSKRGAILNFCLNEDVPPDSLVNYVTENNLCEFYDILELNSDIHQAVYLVYKALMTKSKNTEGQLNN